MRPIGSLLAALVMLSLLTGCTTTQVKEASGHVAGGLLMMVLDVALDGPERRLEERKQRESVPGYEWNPCLRSCEFAAEVAKESRIKEVRERERRAEAEEFQIEFEEFMRLLEEAELKSDDPPSVVLITE